MALCLVLSILIFAFFGDCDVQAVTIEYFPRKLFNSTWLKYANSGNSVILRKICVRARSKTIGHSKRRIIVEFFTQFEFLSEFLKNLEFKRGWSLLNVTVVVKSLSTIQLSPSIGGRNTGTVCQFHKSSYQSEITRKPEDTSTGQILTLFNWYFHIDGKCHLKDPIFFSILCQTLLAVKYYSGEFALHRMTFSEHYLYSHRGILLDI